jgi:hypothetical protein
MKTTLLHNPPICVGNCALTQSRDVNADDEPLMTAKSPVKKPGKSSSTIGMFKEKTGLLSGVTAVSIVMFCIFSPSLRGINSAVELIKSNPEATLLCSGERCETEKAGTMLSHSHGAVSTWSHVGDVMEIS